MSDKFIENFNNLTEMLAVLKPKSAAYVLVEQKRDELVIAEMKLIK